MTKPFRNTVVGCYPRAQLSPSPLRSGGEGRGEEALRVQGETSFDVRRSMLDVRCSMFAGSWKGATVLND